MSLKTILKNIYWGKRDVKTDKNTELYTPVYEGKKDILIANDRIVKIVDEMNITGVGRPNH
ncbi:hypothetical protein [Rossellomorea sp. BNER]|uniref:hypothetical protein n=1 Tax=Rossellomorea sp. BNER TaxID=2962031 RepID=UPI003AF1FD25|nr:hypothetical protein [Rossellomorea sp. BNER]